MILGTLLFISGIIVGYSVALGVAVGVIFIYQTKQKPIPKVLKVFTSGLSNSY